MTTINLDILLKRLLRQRITISKLTETEASPTYGTIVRNRTDYQVRGAVYTNPMEYSYWATLGGMDIGEARGFFFRQYEKDTGEPPHGVPEPENLVTIEESDWITDENGVEWEITRLNYHSEWNYTLVDAILRRRTT